MIIYRSSEVLAIWCKFSHHVPCSCSLEFYFDLINLSRDVLLSPSLKQSLSHLISTVTYFFSSFNIFIIAIPEAHINFKWSPANLIDCPACLLHLHELIAKSTILPSVLLQHCFESDTLFFCQHCIIDPPGQRFPQIWESYWNPRLCKCGNDPTTLSLRL